MGLHSCFQSGPIRCRCLEFFIKDPDFFIELQLAWEMHSISDIVLEGSNQVEEEGKEQIPPPPVVPVYTFSATFYNCIPLCLSSLPEEHHLFHHCQSTPVALMCI